MTNIPSTFRQIDKNFLTFQKRYLHSHSLIEIVTFNRNYRYTLLAYKKNINLTCGINTIKFYLNFKLVYLTILHMLSFKLVYL